MQTWKLFNTKRMRCLLPLISWTGISNALYQATLTSIMVDQMAKDMDIKEKLKQSTLAMIGLGVGELLGSFINGALIDKLNHTKALIICIVEAVIAFAMIHSYIYNGKFSLTFAFLMSAAWGF